jgi:hypothetical protein
LHEWLQVVGLEVGIAAFALEGRAMHLVLLGVAVCTLHGALADLNVVYALDELGGYLIAGHWVPVHRVCLVDLLGLAEYNAVWNGHVPSVGNVVEYQVGDTPMRCCVLKTPRQDETKIIIEMFCLNARKVSNFR